VNSKSGPGPKSVMVVQMEPQTLWMKVFAIEMRFKSEVKGWGVTDGEIENRDCDGMLMSSS